MRDRLRFAFNRIRERLWVKPLLVCVASLAATFLASLADRADLDPLVPEITLDSIESLLTIMSASMLVIATFAVGSMVAAYASASSTATPRAFSLVIADDVSQNALSTFLGAFIFSIVALVALKNSYFGEAGRFALFALTLLVFAAVIVTFVRWVDQIARLGRLGTTVDRVEAAAAAALSRRRAAPTLGAAALSLDPPAGTAVHGHQVGYVQRVDVEALQKQAVAAGSRIAVAALPGTFAGPGVPLAHVVADPGEARELDAAAVAGCFLVGDERVFDEDPRFGLVVLAEIAGRALSPAVNDPGTAIDTLGTLVRLFARWSEPRLDDAPPVELDRIQVPELSIEDMFDDAFTSIARDGAGIVEVAVRLQKALASLAATGHPGLRAAALRHARLALARAEQAMTLPADLELVRAHAAC